MQKRVFFITLFCLLITGLSISSPADEFDQLILKGKKLIAEGMDKWDEKTMLEARSLFERLLQNKDMQWLTHYYIGYADYGLAVYYQSQNKKDLLVKYLDDGIDHLHAAIEAKKKFADAHGLLSSLLGQKIGADPSLGMTLGIEAATTLSDALAYGKDNPRVAMFSAISAQFTPEQFGGSKTRALAEIERSIKLFESEKLEDERLPDWGHSDALTWQGRFYMQADKLDLAEKSLENALKVNSKSAFAQMTQRQLEQKMSQK